MSPDGLKPTSIYLYEASVTGTETALLAAAAAKGISEIRHAACEPHVVELCAFLEQLGVGITGAGTPTIQIDGVTKFGGATHKLWGDYIEAGSWAVVAAVTGGEIEVRGARAQGREQRADASDVEAFGVRLGGLVLEEQRGLALGINQVAGLAGQFSDAHGDSHLISYP